MKVKVTRYYEDANGCGSWFGCYVSEVYAIDKENDAFLVFDPGEFNVAGGFEWVCFTDTMKPCRPEEYDWLGEVPERVPAVELVCEDDEDVEG